MLVVVQSIVGQRNAMRDPAMIYYIIYPILSISSRYQLQKSPAALLRYTRRICCHDCVAFGSRVGHDGDLIIEW